MPGVVYAGGSEARAFQVAEREVRAIVLAGGTRSSTSSSRARKSVPVVVKEQQLHPVRGNLEHIDLQEVKLDEAIQAEVAVELEGADDAPGVKEGGVLEHVTREVTVEALPTEIPEQLVADVSAMEINDTLQLSSVAVPGRASSSSPTTPRRSRSPPSRRRASRRSPSPRSRRRPSSSARRARRPGGRGRRGARRRARATPAATPTRARPCRCSAAATPMHGERILIVGLGNPGREYAGTRHNVGFEVGAELSRRWDLPKAKRKFGGEISEGAHRPGRPAGGDPAAADLHERIRLARPGRRAARSRSRSTASSSSTTRSTCPSARSRPRLGGGLAGHNGLKSLKAGFGSPDFWRVRVGVGRPDSTDPEIVSAYVLGRFREPRDEVAALVGDAADEAERLVEKLGSEDERDE